MLDRRLQADFGCARSGDPGALPGHTSSRRAGHA